MSLKTVSGKHADPRKGRGAGINPEGRFEKVAREAFDDGWDSQEEELPSLKTHVTEERVKSIISRNISPDVPFEQSINPYYGCEVGCPYCVSGDTPVLMASGGTRPIADLRVGDEIFGTARDGWYRCYVKARVLAHWSVIKPAYRITLEDGTTIISGSDHRFLTERGWKFVIGAMCGTHRRPYLTTGNKLMGVGRFASVVAKSRDYELGYLAGIIRGDGWLGRRTYASDPTTSVIRQFRLALCDSEALHRAEEYLLRWGTRTTRFVFQKAVAGRRTMYAIRNSGFSATRVGNLIAWPIKASAGWAAGFLAGIFDAEGSYSSGVLRIPNTDGEIIAWIERCLSTFQFRFVREHVHREAAKPIDIVRIAGGLREHLRFFHTVDPAFSRKLSIEGQAVKSEAKLGVVRIEPLGRVMRLYDITTTTEDFIANGIVSHNCYARPSHAYRNLSPGIDWETRLTAKVNAGVVLRGELSRPGYRCKMISLGANTDPYQPIERKYRITRGILEVCAEFNQPVGIVTKSAMVERDIDLLAPMAEKRLASVHISCNNLDHDLARRLEPRCSAPARRLLAMRRLSDAGIPVGVLVAPVIPFLTDQQIEPVLEAAWAHGARGAGYVLMRLPYEVKDIFREWLERNYPLKAKHVMSRVHQIRGGRDNDPRFGGRMSGEGELARLLEQRFEQACERLGFNSGACNAGLDTTQFKRPRRDGQMALFGD